MSGRRSSVLLAAALLAGGVLFISPPAMAAFPGANGKIVFSGGDQNGPGVAVVNPDGSGETLLTHGRGLTGPEEPAWSPDGTKIAYSDPAVYNGQGDPDYQIFTINADGSGQTNISQTGNPYYSDYEYRQPAWSPDGTKIVYTNGALWTMNADGTSQKELFYAPVQSLAPAWSPDGRKIAFALTPGVTNYAPYQIQTINADGSGQTNVSNSAANDTMPAWSPDGTKIVFQRSVNAYPGSPAQIYTMNADGSGQTNISNSAANDTMPAWSPDGTKIVFLRLVNGPSYFYTMNPDGSQQTSLGVGGRNPDWQPLPGPQRADYKNAAQFCKAERDFLGDSSFEANYGGGANVYGKCVSGK